ncbi:MAG TPA: ERF family protein [Myxococcaceae bacterium]|nr:ERF family protein [Myxococcaceae bacterium]
MHRSSESIAALAAALAKAQSELANPEKSLVATIGTDRPGEGARTFRYAPLSSGLEIIRKALGHQQIATVQTTAIDAASGTISMTTVLAHASGEWIASDWPVCRLADTASPHRMGAALTYARRYALFTLVGIAGEDDLDAPDLNGSAQPKGGDPGHPSLVRAAAASYSPPRPRGNGKDALRPILDSENSAALRDQLVREIASLDSAEKAAQWARTAVAAKNTLTASDSRLLEVAFELRLSSFVTESSQEPRQTAPEAGERPGPFSVPPDPGSALLGLGSGDRAGGPAKPAGIDKSVLPIGEARRYRDKAHLKFVASQPCLICGRRPSDPHHLRFAQKRALGRKVSDEFTVPLCRLHHRELHRSGDERAWWNRAGIDSVKIAQKLWKKTRHLPASGIPAGTTAAGANAHDSQVAHAGEKGPASQGAAVESDVP